MFSRIHNKMAAQAHVADTAASWSFHCDTRRGCRYSFAGQQGKITISAGENTDSFTLADGTVKQLPFSLRLRSVRIECYPGTPTPADYVSELTVDNGSGEEDATVSMNNVLDVRGYRFYETAMGTDHTVLSVSHDPWGIGLTYGGYFLLLFAMVSFFFSRKTRFLRL